MGKAAAAAVGVGTSDGWEAWKAMNGKVEGGGQGVALEGVVAVGGEGEMVALGREAEAAMESLFQSLSSIATGIYMAFLKKEKRKKKS